MMNKTVSRSDMSHRQDNSSVNLGNVASGPQPILPHTPVQRHHQLISSLRNDARGSITDISRSSGIPVSTLFDALHDLERSGILRHVSLLDFEKSGFHSHAFVGIKTSPDQRMRLRDWLRSKPAVNSVFRVDGGMDYVVEAVFPSQREFHEFIEEMESKNIIIAKQVFNVLDVVQKEGFMVEDGC